MTLTWHKLYYTLSNLPMVHVLHVIHVHYLCNMIILQSLHIYLPLIYSFQKMVEINTTWLTLLNETLKNQLGIPEVRVFVKITCKYSVLTVILIHKIGIIRGNQWHHYSRAMHLFGTIPHLLLL